MQRKKLNGIVFALLAGGGYLLWIWLTGLAIPCVFRSVTGWLCPGCGITTLILCLMRSDIQGAWKANSFLFVTGPFLILEGLYAWRYTQRRKSLPQWNRGLLAGYLTALIVFGVWRNVR